MSRVAASEIDAIVTQALAIRIHGVKNGTDSRDAENSGHHDDHFVKVSASFDGSMESFAGRTAVEEYIERIIVGSQSIEIRWNEEQARDGFAEGAQSNSTAISWQQTTFRRKRELMQPGDGARPIRAVAQAKLLAAIVKGRAWLEEILSDPSAKIEIIAMRENLPERSARSILSLAFVVPDIVKGAVAATLPRGFGVSRLIDLPSNWDAQRVALGLPARS